MFKTVTVLATSIVVILFFNFKKYPLWTFLDSKRRQEIQHLRHHNKTEQNCLLLRLLSLIKLFFFTIINGVLVKWEGIYPAVYVYLTVMNAFYSLQGIAQINLSDLESSSEMQLHWYSVQIFTGSDPQRPKNKHQCEESIPRSSGNVTTVKTVWLWKNCLFNFIWPDEWLLAIISLIQFVCKVQRNGYVN